MLDITVTVEFDNDHAWECYIAKWEDLCDFRKIAVWDENGKSGNYFDCDVDHYLDDALRMKIVKKIKKIKLLDVMDKLDGGYITLYNRRIAGGYIMTINVQFDEEECED